MQGLIATRPGSSSNCRKRISVSRRSSPSLAWTSQCWPTSSKKVVRTDKRRLIVDYLKSRYNTSERRDCRLVGMARRVYSYKSCKDPETALRQRMRELAVTRMRYGYRKIGVLLKRERCRHSTGVMYRIYREEGLGLRYPLGSIQSAGHSATTKAGCASQPGVAPGLRRRPACQ